MIICESKRCHQRLSEKRHNLRSNSNRIGGVRESMWPVFGHAAKEPVSQKQVFDLLIAVEQLQKYAEHDLDKKLHDHNMTNVKGVRRCVVSDHIHCHAECQ
jgi:hypothetical protein